MPNNLVEISSLLRALIIKSTTESGTGHPTSSLSSVHLMATLMFGGYFKADLNDPEYINNDRLIFSKGHAAPLFYSLYTVAGKVSLDELMTLRKFGSNLEGHPTMNFAYTEAATGSLGQGLSIGSGMALEAKHKKLDYKTFVLLGDSEMAEGSIWEAMEIASHYKLNNLVAIVDVNRLGQRGETLYGWDLETYRCKAEAFGWEVWEVGGHDLEEIERVYEEALNSDTDRPKMILAKTKKGFGVSFAENKEGFHGKAFSKDQAEIALAEIGKVEYTLTAEVCKPEFLGNELKPTLKIIELPKYNIGDIMSTRKAYGQALLEVAKANSEVIVLDAEMNNSTFSEYVAKELPNQYLEMYIAEQNMIGVALGLSRRGRIPFVSTFAAFLSRAYDQIRMLQYSSPNIKIMGSHCGVSIGEDGSSQMALEDLAWSRAIHNSNVFYPADANSMAKMVDIAHDIRGLFYLRGTRADLPVIYGSEEKYEIGGSKTLFESDGDEFTLVGAGITLHEILKAYEVLKSENLKIRVVDLYSVKPVDRHALEKAKLETKHIIVVEDHYKEGGIFSAVAETLASSKGQALIHSLAVNKLPISGKPQELLVFEEIDSKAIVNKVLSLK